MDVILKMLSVVEANYPEALKHCYIINGENVQTTTIKRVWVNHSAVKFRGWARVLSFQLPDTGT